MQNSKILEKNSRSFHSSNSITPTMAEVLMVIWEITGKNDSKILATHKEIETRLKNKNKRFNRVSTILSEFNSLPTQNCIESFKVFNIDDSSGTAKKGQPPLAYCFHSEMVTLPQTACILMELMNYLPSETYLIYRSQFVNHIQNKYGWEKDFIENRINEASKAKYIIASNLTSEEQSLWGSVRIQREWEYLILLARESNDKN